MDEVTRILNDIDNALKELEREVLMMQADVGIKRLQLRLLQEARKNDANRN